MTSRGLSSERIARGILERMNFQVLEERKKIVINGVEVAEVDAIAKSPENITYSVEIKAGKISVSDVRHAYGNAKLLNLNPLIVCKGFIDTAAETTASELNVKVIQLPDYYLLLEPEELELIIHHAIQDALEDYEPQMFFFGKKISRKDAKIIEAIATSDNIVDAANIAKLSVENFSKKIAYLKSRKIFTSTRNYKSIRKQAIRILGYLSFEKRLKNIEKSLKNVIKKLDEHNKKD
ncbi:MAG: recombinase RecB [Nitrososphaerota archaeon]